MKNIPAFPRPATKLEHLISTAPAQDGMTLRDYFAAHVMQGLVASGEIERWPAAAHDAYVAADYMLEAREK